MWMEGVQATQCTMTVSMNGFLTPKYENINEAVYMYKFHSE